MSKPNLNNSVPYEEAVRQNSLGKKFKRSGSLDVLEDTGEIDEGKLLSHILKLYNKQDLFILLFTDDNKRVASIQIAGTLGAVSFFNDMCLGARLDLTRVDGNEEELRRRNYRAPSPYGNFGLCTKEFAGQYNPKIHDHLSVPLRDISKMYCEGTLVYECEFVRQSIIRLRIGADLFERT